MEFRTIFNGQSTNEKEKYDRDIANHTGINKKVENYYVCTSFETWSNNLTELNVKKIKHGYS